ncbi:phytanoyl-CoA hydroxylase [Saccharata proteae CBS 121410]|uniref:Phytanoyl-CoA hydroxylase n=1 Tax=Saccharata proteae CBS 121410 TaxID=1314787 RepID=A0A9P4HXN6_9PEZI|nr:phytanoyl-CoA hydroxylase [Saccharata proteae CBS 121410]
MPHASSPDTSTAPLTIANTPLLVNDGPLQPSQVAYLRPSSPDEPIDILRARYAQDGYLFLKQLLPRPDVLAARSAYFDLLSPSGVLKPGTDAVQGIFDPAKDPADYPGIGAGATDNNGRPGGESAKHFVDLALKAHTEDWYADTFCKHPVLMDFVKAFTGWGEDALALKRTLLRNNTPGNRAIGVHYDQIFLRYGDPSSVTAWVPMGDVKLNGGGLIYLEDGHTLGTELEAAFTAKALATGLTPEQTKNAFNQNMMSTGFLAEGPTAFGAEHKRRWLVTAYEAGDVVLHSPHAIHASTINCDPQGVIRVGTDLRFVDTKKDVDTRWLDHYRFGDGV